MMTPCIGIGRLLGHNFQPRHDVVPPTLSHARNASTADLIALAKVINAGAQRIYKADVCTRCGQKVAA